MLLLVVVAALSIAPARAGGADGYEFHLDGERVRARNVLSWTVAGDLREGDLVRIGSYPLVLGPPGRYVWHRDRLRLVRETEDGRETTVGVACVGTEGLEVDGLAGLTEDAKSRLRCVTLGFWNERVAAEMAGVDFSRAVVVVDENACRWPAKLPALPTGIRHLVIDLNYNLRYGRSKVKDLSSLSALTDLESLASEAPESSFDLTLVKECGRLRTLDLSDQRVVHPELLAKLTALQRLVLLKSAVRDLSPLADLPAIRVVDADFSRVAILPKTKIPSLVELHVMGAEVSDEAVAAFAAKNPQCRVWHRFGPAFRRELEGADRLRVIVDPSAKEDPGKELFAVEGADAVADFLGRIAVFEKGSPGAFSMAPSPWRIQVRRGEELLASLGMPEPNLISGVDRLPSHLTLTPASAERVADWFAEHGVNAARERLKKYRRERGAEWRRWQAYDPLLPETLYRWATYGMNADEALAEFRTTFPDPVVRAGMYVLVLGASEARWDRDLGIDELVAGSLLPAVNQRTLDRVAVLAMKDVRGVRGLGRWLFGEGRLDSLNDRTLAKVFPDVARYALASPYRVNRQRTMTGLGGIGGRVAIALLTEVLDETIVHRRLPDPGEDAVAGEVPWRQSERFEPESDLGDAAFAALVLAKLGEKKCLPRLRELASAADGADRAAFEEAIEALTP